MSMNNVFFLGAAISKLDAHDFGHRVRFFLRFQVTRTMYCSVYMETQTKNLDNHCSALVTVAG